MGSRKDKKGKETTHNKRKGGEQVGGVQEKSTKGESELMRKKNLGKTVLFDYNIVE